MLRPPLRPVRRILAASIQPQPDIILEHVALIRSGSGAGLALVKEAYLPDLISVAPAPALWQRARDRTSERSATRTVGRER